jgi:RimJ/RimL family protein N-acetyltransferase
MRELFPVAIETERLRLERASRENVDLLRYYEICSSDPGIEAVTEYVPWSPHETPKETLEFFERKERQWDEGEKAPYVIRPREGEDGAGEIAGQCGLRPDWDRRSCVLNLWLRKRFWGRGYSSERAAAMFELAFDRLDLELAAANVLVDNDNSKRAIERYVERFGGQRDGRLRNNFVVDGEPVDQYRYSVSREEWAEHRPEDHHLRLYDEP